MAHHITEFFIGFNSTILLVFPIICLIYWGMADFIFDSMIFRTYGKLIHKITGSYCEEKLNEEDEPVLQIDSPV